MDSTKSFLYFVRKFNLLMDTLQRFVHTKISPTLESRSTKTLMLLGFPAELRLQFAQRFHSLGDRRERPFYDYTSRELEEELQDSHCLGLFRKAGGGTLFFDEIDLLPTGTRRDLFAALRMRLEDPHLDVEIIISVHDHRDQIPPLISYAFRNLLGAEIIGTTQFGQPRLLNLARYTLPCPPWGTTYDTLVIEGVVDEFHGEEASVLLDNKGKDEKRIVAAESLKKGNICHEGQSFLLIIREVKSEGSVKIETWFEPIGDPEKLSTKKSRRETPRDSKHLG